MGRNRIVGIAALAAVLGLVLGSLGSPAGAQTVEVGPSRAAIAGFDTGSFYAEIVAVQEDTVSETGLEQASYGCVVFGSRAADKQDEACGPLTVEIDPFLETGRITGTLESLLGTITLDITVVGTGVPEAGVAPEVTQVDASFSALLSRSGDASGTIGSTGIGQNEGSSWYGQLTQQAGGRVSLP